MSSEVAVVRRVVIIDDHPLLATGLEQRLRSRGFDVVVPELGDVEILLEVTMAMAPDLVVLDLGLPFDGGGEALLAPLAANGVKVLHLTGEDDPDLWARCLEAGAVGILSKVTALDTIIDTVVDAANGEPVLTRQRDEVIAEARLRRKQRQFSLAPFESLTSREAAVLGGLLEGRSPAAIAERDFVAIDTIRSQIKSMMRKLQVNSQLEAVALAHDSGWAPDRGDGLR